VALENIEMTLEQAVGLACLVYGAVVAVWRVKSPARLFKYAAFQKRWGETRGKWLHVAAYTIIPVIFGLWLLWK
jgi:hypothetical protein